MEPTRMHRHRHRVFGLVALAAALAAGSIPSAARAADAVPRPEHPTPDAVRPHWSNLNGPWQFRFDPKDEGKAAGWEKAGAAALFDRSIVVPFPWESRLSKVNRPDYHGVAWYRREFQAPESFPADGRVWLRFGAVDWEADVWVNGTHVARHEGGYSPFEADVTDALKAAAGKPSTVVVRVFDPTDPSLPVGKQVGWYTTTSGIWQTVWLESRPAARIDRWTVKTEIDPARATFQVKLAGVRAGKYRLSLTSKAPGVGPVETPVSVTEDSLKAGPAEATLVVPVADAKLWTPETPNLYDVTLALQADDGPRDEVQTYFGLRTIARGRYGDAPYERILLNGKPVYLRLALDQSFNPEGVYTAPDDEFLVRDLAIAKYNGLNGLRIHIKPDEPRRLYYADKMGLLIFEDMPNSWRQNARARAAWENTMRETVARDANHPAIIAWIAFNETWGLGTPDEYKKDVDTQKWVGRMVDQVRKLDPTRLVEDQSPCNYDHVEDTDLNSWHFYIDDHAEAERHVADVVKQTKPGSPFNYCPGQAQGTAPLINSEYGGVSAGSGDRDVSWSFRDLTTILRHQPQIQGYVYTELSDIEWEHNGFVNYDRSPKRFGYDAFIPDMRPNELNGADFIGFGGPPVLVVKPGETVTVPVFLSHFSEHKGPIKLRWWVAGWTDKADFVNAVAPKSVPADWRPYDVTDLTPVTFKAPDRPFVGSVNLTLRDKDNQRMAANYVNLVVRPETPLPKVEKTGPKAVTLRFAPGDFSSRSWSGPWGVSDGKAFGQGSGHFEYTLKLPEAVIKAGVERVETRFELGAKAGRDKVDWPSRVNPEDYPQTDTRVWPSLVKITLNGGDATAATLDDDAADARGVLSHLKKFHHGSYGDLIETTQTVTPEVVASLAAGKPLALRLTVPNQAGPRGGLSVFGAETGQFPFDPTVIVHTREPLPESLDVDPARPAAVNRVADRRLTPLETGESPRAAEWSYTTSDPGEAWSRPDFDASAWPRGKAGFGTRQTPGVRVGTVWESPRVWLRKAITLPAFKPDDALTLRLFHDEDAEVFVNGKPLVRKSGYISGYEDIRLDAAQAGLFVAGENTIAVSCRQTRGGQGIDLGLTIERAE